MYVEMVNWNNSPYKCYAFIVNAHVRIQSPLRSLVEDFCIPGNDFSGLWSQLRGGHYSEYVLYLNLIGSKKAVTTDKWSLFESGHMHRFDFG